MFSFPECVTVSAREGEYQFRAGAGAADGGETCGFFIVGDADQIVKVEMTEIDVSCGDGGLVVVSRREGGPSPVFGREFLGNTGAHGKLVIGQEKSLDECSGRLVQTNSYSLFYV